MVYKQFMAKSKLVRRSISLPQTIDKEIRSIARARGISSNQVLLELIEAGLRIHKQQEEAFFGLADRFRRTDDKAKIRQLGIELGRLVFGK